MNRTKLRAALADPKKRRKLLRDTKKLYKLMRDIALPLIENWPYQADDLPTEGYRVTYEIDVGTESPRDAAIKVAGIMRYPTYQPEFTIRDHRTGETSNIDLEKPE